MPARDEDVLLDAAASIADGTDVEWRQLHDPPSSVSSARLVRELKAIEQIATFHRHDDPSVTATTQTPQSDGIRVRRWAHLTIVAKIAEGGYGAVYRAHDPKLQTDVALKLVPLPADRTEDAARALKEARLLARVRHAHIVRVYGADIVDGYVGIWMEFIEGETLASLVRARGPLGAHEAAVIVRELCHALSAVHAAQLIHGDIKAHNVMREAGGRIVLMDFGTGRDLGVAPAAVPNASDFAGTPLYLAPEVFEGARRSRVSDIYALGVLLYHLVTNSYPVAGRTQVEVENAHSRGIRTAVRDARPDLPSDLVDVIECATAVDPRNRYQTAGAFDAALAAFLNERHDDQHRARRVAPWVAAATATAAIIGLAYYQFSRRSAAPATAVTTTAPAAAPAASSYKIATTLYRRSGGNDTKLRRGDRVAAGDQIYAVLKVSAPTYVYIVNEDDRGESFLLYPLPGQAVDNPLLAGAATRIPGTQTEQVNWQITSSGGREHFLIFASPDRLPAFEELFATLPRPSFSAPLPAAKLPTSTVSKLRGVGGLTATPSNIGLSKVFVQPLGEEEESAAGLFVRQFTVENPGR